MERHPKPSDRLGCFMSYRASHRPCSACEDREACEEATVRWESRHSLSEELADLERELAPSSGESPKEVYCRVYAKHYGRRPSRASMARFGGVFLRLKFYCEDNHLDMATFVTAQMHYSWKFLKAVAPSTFQPNMLFRKGFQTRLNMYLRDADARLLSGDTALDHRTKLEKFARMMELSEESVARYFVAGYVSGNRVSWESAVKMVSPHATWLALDMARRREIGEWENRVHKIQLKYGATAVAAVKTLAELRAAVSIAEGYEHGLADRIGCGDRFMWRPFAQVILRRVGKRKRGIIAVSGVEGTAWRG